MRGVLRTSLALSALVFAFAAEAAAVRNVNGAVSLSRGAGYQKIARSTTANPGDTVMAGPTGRAEIIYSDGCKVTVEPGTVVTVAATPPCQVGLARDHTLLVVGGLAAAGGITALVLSNDDKASSP